MTSDRLAETPDWLSQLSWPILSSVCILAVLALLFVFVHLARALIARSRTEDDVR